MLDVALVYSSGLVEVARINVETADLRVLLVQPSYQPAISHAVVDDETGDSPRAHEMPGEGYARQMLTGRRLVEDPATGGAYLDADDPAFGAIEPGERIGGAVLFREAGSDRLSPLIAFYPLGRRGTTGGPVLVEWAPPEAGRVLRLLPAPVL
jgi:hypothetical protein